MVERREDERERKRPQDEQGARQDQPDLQPRETPPPNRERRPADEQDIESPGQQPQNLQHEDNAEGARQKR
jgi:hypothetical protein